MLFSKILRPRLLHIRGLLRVMVFFSVLGCFSVWFLFRTASAHAEEGAKSFGAELLAALGPDVISEPEALTLNGQRMFIASKVTDLSVDTVLDRLDRYCQENSGRLAEGIGKLPASVKGNTIPENLRDPATWLTARSKSADGEVGQIACFVRPSSVFEFAGRLGRFVKSGNLSELGEFRYVVARKSEYGNTHVLTTWTEGKFDVFAMFPEQGDAPGQDPRAGVPRPPTSVRKLSADVAGHPYGVRMYESPKKPAELLSFYDAEMKKAGWSPAPVGALEPAETDLARVFSKDGAHIIVTALELPSLQGQTQLSILEMGTLGTVKVDY